MLKSLTGLSRGLVESARVFPRWMYDHGGGCGTCLLAPPIVLSEDDDPIVVSFFDDVIKSSAVVKLMLSVNHFVHATSKAVDGWLDQWRKFDKEEALWSPKRKSMLEKFRKRNPPVVSLGGPRGLDWRL